jgi:ATP-dependent helicase/nuclease subunit B
MSATVQSIAVSARACVAEAARAIIDQHRAALPDLRGVAAVIPDMHAASAVAQALREAAALPVLLLPKLVTLRQWAAEVTLDQPLQPRAAREAVLYGALAGHASLGEADRWAIAGELLALFDELTRHAVSLPQSAKDFAQQLERAYRARRNRSFDFEAALVHELWHLMTKDARELDAETAYPLRLAQIASAATLPLYALGLRRLAPSEQRFFDAYAKRAPVVMFETASDPGDAISTTLAAAWPATPAAQDLLARARALQSAFPLSTLTQRVSVFGAADAETEARAADVQVRDWLLAGKQRIAVIALDRVTARRARALLERAGVLIRDESGWPMATTSAATVLARWLDVASNDTWHGDLLDLMKSPFAFHDWPRETRQQAVWRLERYVREASVVAGIANFIALAEQHNDAEVRQLLMRVQRALQTLPRTRCPLAHWLAALTDSLDEIGVIGGWRADSAGLQVSDFIDKLQNDLSGNTLAVPLADWRRWLTRQLEAASFVESTVTSPVMFTHLAATPLRLFDAALVLGCDARHLSGANGAPRFFNQSVRAQLGLPTHQDEARDTEALLAQLIAATPRVVLSWQTHNGAEENLLAPPLERLLALHRCAYGNALAETRLAALVAHTTLRCADISPVAPLLKPPAPAAERDLIPGAISASGYNTLIACPYQFHARYLLRLGALDEVEELIDKSGYGQHVHEILTAFHRELPCVGAAPAVEAAARLSALSDSVFARSVGRNALARGWLLRWKSLIPAYLDWQRARESEGWRWHAGEAARELAIRTPAGREFKLVGRLDRVDRNAAGATAVVDYKTRSESALNKSLAIPGEDVQLPVYALLWREPVTQALYVSMDRDAVNTVALPGELDAQTASAHERLAKAVDALHDSCAVPAQGAAAACQWCEMHGLCRRAHWP